MRFALSSRAVRRAPSPIRELVPLMSLDGMISFGGGYPNPKTFAFTRITADLAGGGQIEISGADLVAATQYGPTDGLPALREELVRWHAHHTGSEPPGPPLVLNGSQEGLYLLADVLLDPGDAVVVTEPTYPGALACFRSFGATFEAVPTDGGGMRTDALAARLAELHATGDPLPRLIYAIPNGDNPGGTTLPEARRRELAALARRYDLPLVEDDPYALVRLEDTPPRPTLQSLAPEHVLRLDSFSKILAPGLRLGYATGPAELLRAMVLHKQASNLHTSSLSQALLLGLLRAEGPDGLRTRVDAAVARYRVHRDAMVASARRHLPEGCSFTVPDSGMFLWVTLPAGCDADRMVREHTRDLGVLVVPGPAFSTQGGLRDAVRTSFSLVGPEAIDEGMRRLGEMIRRELRPRAPRR